MLYNKTERVNFVTFHFNHLLRSQYDLDLKTSARHVSTNDIYEKINRHYSSRGNYQVRRLIVKALKDYPQCIENDHYYYINDDLRKIKQARIMFNIKELNNIGLSCQIYLRDCNNNNRLLSRSLYKTLEETVDNADIRNEDAIRMLNHLNTTFYESYGTKQNRHFTITAQTDGNFTYMPAGKPTLINSNDSWPKTTRQSIRIGKGLKKIFSGMEIPADTVEKLSNIIKSRYHFAGTIKIVKGIDIKKYYHYSKHASGSHGSLTQSCMRHDSCQDYFQIYTKNPDKVSMAIAVTPDDKVLGRAIIWNAKNDKTGEDVVFMDRAYGNDLTIEALKKYGSEMGAYVKYRQTYNCDRAISTIGEVENVEFSVQLENTDNRTYPYMDTMYYTNDISGDTIEITTYEGDIELTSTDGYIDDDDNYVTDYDGERLHSDDATYCEHIDSYVHSDDATYSEPYGNYIRENDSVYVDGEYYLDDDDDLVNTACGGYHHTDNCKYSEYMQDWIHEDTDTEECHVHGLILADDAKQIAVEDHVYIVHNDVTEDELIENI